MIIFFISLASVAGAQDIKYDDRLSEQIQKYGQAEVCFSYPGIDELTRIGRKVPVSAIKNGMAYCVLSARDVDAFLSFQLNYKIIPLDESKAVESAMSVEEAMNWDLYPTYQQYDSIMRKLAADYPEICRLDTIGLSIEGRLILALKISDNVHEDEDEPEVFYTSNMHGDELQGFVLLLRLAEHLLANAGKGELEQTLVDKLEIWINPLSNPDGTYNGGDTISYPTRANTNGTDLNRNFPDPLDPSIDPDIENIAMINFMKGRNFVLSANLHAGYEVVNFPWDRWFTKIPADSVWFYNISRRYVDTVHNHSVETYMDSYNDGVVRGAVWYIIYGGRQDYVTYDLHGREVTIELDNTKQTPAAQLPLLWEYNYRSFLGFLENALYGIHGRVLDDESGLPLRARIYIEGHDKDNSYVYSDSLYGSFVRMLSPGTWDITVSAGGYQDKRVKGIVLEEMQQEYLTVRLAGGLQADKLPYENRIRIWPVPAGNQLFVDTETLIGARVGIRICSYSGMLVYNNEVMIDSEEMQMDISFLSPGYYILSLTDTAGRSYHGAFIRY